MAAHPFHTPDSTLETDHPELAAWLGEHAGHWIVEDLVQRIMCGEIIFLSDAAEHLAEGIEEEDLAPDGPRDAEDAAGPLARQLWRYCETAAEAWTDEHTDADRVIEAFESLAERGIACGVFTDFEDLELDESDPGGVIIWVNEWENLDPRERRDLTITFAGLDQPDETIGRELVDALRGAGLEPGEPQDETVTVPVVWKWHVGRDAAVEEAFFDELDGLENDFGELTEEDDEGGRPVR